VRAVQTRVRLLPALKVGVRAVQSHISRGSATLRYAPIMTLHPHHRRIGQTAQRLQFDADRRNKAAAKVRGLMMQEKIEGLELIIKELEIKGLRSELMEARCPQLMSARVERLKRQVLLEERDTKLAEDQVCAPCLCLVFHALFSSSNSDYV
jgi:hypothetical protein